MAIITGTGAVSAGAASANIIHAQDNIRYVPSETFEMTLDGEPCIHVKDMTYTIRGENPRMRALVAEWISTGKVKRIG